MFIDAIAYSRFLQNNVAPAAYYRVLSRLDEFEKTSFLAYLNNLNNHDPQMKENFSALKKLKLIKMTNDEVVSPMESAWFSHYDEDMNIIPY